MIQEQQLQTLSHFLLVIFFMTHSHTEFRHTHHFFNWPTLLDSSLFFFFFYFSLWDHGIEKKDQSQNDKQLSISMTFSQSYYDDSYNTAHHKLGSHNTFLHSSNEQLRGNIGCRLGYKLWYHSILPDHVCWFGLYSTATAKFLIDFATYCTSLSARISYHSGC